MHARAPRARVKISTRIFRLPMIKAIFHLGDFSFVRIFLKNYRVTMTTTLELHVRKI